MSRKIMYAAAVLALFAGNAVAQSGGNLPVLDITQSGVVIKDATTGQVRAFQPKGEPDYDADQFSRASFLYGTWRAMAFVCNRRDLASAVDGHQNEYSGLVHTNAPDYDLNLLAKAYSLGTRFLLDQYKAAGVEHAQCTEALLAPLAKVVQK